MRNLLILLCVLGALHSSCSSDKSQSNNKELPYNIKKVINHYSKRPSDSLKLKALGFLIHQMTYQYEITGTAVEKYRKDIGSLFQNPQAKHDEISQKLDQVVYPPGPISVKMDLTTIKPKFLIQHIDKAFEIYNYPWCRPLSFKTFCEYILPYRIAHEPIEPWLPYYNNHFKELIDYFLTHSPNDSLKCMLTLRYLSPTQNARKIQYSSPCDLSPQWYLNVLTNWDFANCRELAMLGMYSFKSLGLPVSWDFTPKWANGSSGHNWNAIEINGQTIPFLAKDDHPFGQHLSARKFDKISKVFRHTFVIQPESLAAQTDLKEKVPAIFTNPCIKDVTDLYCPCFDVSIPIGEVPSAKFMYLLSFDNHDWIPVDWGRITGHHAQFRKVPAGNMYLLGYYMDGNLHITGSPFLVTEQGGITAFNPDRAKMQTVSLSRKYPPKNVYAVFEQMLGGIFQGANRPDFADAVDLYHINDLDDLKPTMITLQAKGEFLYFRYLSAPKGYCNMAEIELLDRNGRTIQGEIISSNNFYPDKDARNVFDGNPLTYASSITSTDSWVGLALKNAITIDRIVFTPRTDENYIVKDNKYELFYYDHGWQSAGTRIAENTGDFLEFTNVPGNAVLLLQNRTKGNEERIFLYNNKQIWF